MPASARAPSRRPEPRNVAVDIVRRLQERGFVAYLAGGCVRDTLLGQTPKDYDVATDARPDQVQALFARTRFVGEAFGVVLVQCGAVRIEVATFRTEWGYEDGRRPTHVSFSDAEHDARRRDFTINGLFEDPIAGTVIDHVGGRADLAAHVVRAIGVPDERFGEDYLRMLRAVRFAAAFDFRIEPDTGSAIRRHSARLAAISRERIGQEVLAMLGGPRPAQAALLLQELDLDAPVLGEPHGTAPPAVLARLGGAAVPVALAAWGLDRHLACPGAPATGSVQELAQRLERFAQAILPDLLGRWQAALCLSNEQRQGLRDCLLLLTRALGWRRLGLAGRKRLLAEPRWPWAWALLRALAAAVPASAELVREIDEQQGPLLESGVAPPPLVDGNDLLGLGLAPGPVFAQLLARAYDAQLEGAVRTRQEALAWLSRTAQTSEAGG